MPFYVVQQGDVLPQEAGCYVSFPSLARDPSTGAVIVLYRRAMYDATDRRPEMRAHGLDGHLCYKQYSPQSDHFSPETVLHRAWDWPCGIIDGVVTTLGERLFLFLRLFPETPPVYYQWGSSLTTLNAPRLFHARDIFVRGAQWGKILPVDDGRRLLQVYYVATHRIFYEAATGQAQKPVPRPALYHSLDDGETWSFVSWIAPQWAENNVSFNETAIVESSGVLYALMRTMDTPDGALFLTFSRDGGDTWADPRPAGLCGQAPMFYTLPTGQILVGFRGFLPDSPAVGGTYALAEFFPDSGCFGPAWTVETYHGNHYDGGYGDLLWLPEQNKLLVVYYTSNQLEPRNPWLRYALIDLDL